MSRLLDAKSSLLLDLHGVKLIEASAGTGKTYTLANLYLRHIYAGRTPAEILVVSFTNAATEELHQRIHLRLLSALQVLRGANSDDEFLTLLTDQFSSLSETDRDLHRRRLEFALRSMDEAMITTIHGFCYRALQDHALLAQQPFESEIITNDDSFWAVALKDWWRKASYSLSSDHWALFHQAIPSISKLSDWHRQLRQQSLDGILPAETLPLAELLDQLQSTSATGVASKQQLSRIKARAIQEADQFARQRVFADKMAKSKLAFQDQLDLLLEALQRDHQDDLGGSLRQRYPVAMIDEFQDTDPTQYEIFRRIYLNQAAISLTLIGDPKQAIYSFRGGDIFTYIKARAEPSVEIFALRINWRSQAKLIDAVNLIFGRHPQPFIYDQAIPFEPAIAADGQPQQALFCNQQEAAAMTLWHIPLLDNGKTQTVEQTRQQATNATVAEIARILHPDSQSCIGERKLNRADIAILVRDHTEGSQVRDALAEVGIGAVTIGRDQVFKGDEAEGLYALLAGIGRPRDQQSHRRALASSLFNHNHLKLTALIEDDDSWQSWVEQLRSLHQIWIKSGFIAMFSRLTQRLELGAALANQQRAERKLVNLTHLTELLQQQSRSLSGIDALLSWFAEQMQGDNHEAFELRLESDADLVKIVTLHKSKGLEYSVVFLPFPWRCKLATKNATQLHFHDDQFKAWLDLGSEQFDAHRFRAEKERLAEDLRLLYVALTRAKSKVYLAWGDVGNGRASGQPKHSALAYLLHSDQSPADLETALPSGIQEAGEIFQDIQKLISDNPNIEIKPLPIQAAGKPIEKQSKTLKVPELSSFQRPSKSEWRISSFSSLTRDVHQPIQMGELRSQDDAILDFPAGSHTGLLLHQLLEEIDFQQNIEHQSRAKIALLAPQFGISDPSKHSLLVDWLNQIVATDLDLEGLRLNRVAADQRLNELQFDFSINHFDVHSINQLIQQNTDQPLIPIDTTDFRGLLTGIIDLVFEYRGKFYLADYKSNFLGSSLEDYRAPLLAKAMIERRYDLQSLIYALALHRYLDHRLPNYQYQQHFGGSYYLFLRAMRPQSGPTLGVHFERPSEAFMTAWNQQLSVSSKLELNL